MLTTAHDHYSHHESIRLAAGRTGATVRKIALYEPSAAGIVCFEVDAMTPDAAVARLLERRVVASVSPYATPYVRLAPSLVTSPVDVDTALAAVLELHSP